MILDQSQGSLDIISDKCVQAELVLCRVWCSKLSGPAVLLLGDAAHAVTPVGGQGANAALEDCLFLDSILESTGKGPH